MCLWFLASLAHHNRKGRKEGHRIIPRNGGRDSAQLLEAQHKKLVKITVQISSDPWVCWCTKTYIFCSLRLLTKMGHMSYQTPPSPLLSLLQLLGNHAEKWASLLFAVRRRLLLGGGAVRFGVITFILLSQLHRYISLASSYVLLLGWAIRGDL